MGIPIARLRHVPLVQIYGGSFEWEAPPSDDRPWLDDRSPAMFAIVLGLVPNDRVTLGFRRFALPPDVPVQIVSRNPGVVRVSSPADGNIASGDAEIQLEAGTPTGDDHTDVEIAVQCAGKMIHSITARVFRLLEIRLAPYRVRIGPAGYESAMTRPPMEDAHVLEAGMNHYYRRIGLHFTFDALVDLAVAGSNQARMAISGDSFPELDRAIAAGYNANAVNMYFTAHLADEQGHEDDETLGKNMTGASRPCLVVKAQRGTSPRFFSTLAHETGHYFGLRHPLERDDSVPEPPASRWFLMYWSSPSGRLIPLKWVTADGAGRFNENGATTVRDAVRRLGLAR
jgi:hypothetical protein